MVSHVVMMVVVVVVVVIMVSMLMITELSGLLHVAFFLFGEMGVHAASVSRVCLVHIDIDVCVRIYCQVF